LVFFLTLSFCYILEARGRGPKSEDLRSEVKFLSRRRRGSSGVLSAV
jgi:hypothetical protein